MTFSAVRGAKTLTLLLLVSSVAACGLPRSGPHKREIFAGSFEKQGDAFVVPVNRFVSRVTAVTPAFGFNSNFRSADLIGSDVIAAGDTLGITVFENVRDDPLLGNSGQRVSSLDQVQVDGQGYIYVPYAGRIRAAGQTPDGLRQAITRKLDTQTPDPQVSVQRLAGDGSSVTVSGAVGSQGVFPIERPTRTLSAMLARAGGTSVPVETAIVRVTRNGNTSQIWLQDLYDNPALDIALRPGDVIVIEEDDRSFVALGATGHQTRIQFETQNVSAIEALAQVGGLNTQLADPKGVFVLRDEPAEIANSLLGRTDLVGDQRMVYVLDLTRPTGLFEARDFMIRDGDTVYVTEAPFVQWQKTLSAITGATSAANQASNVGN
ncbi:polysaccharide biosynthesis/export family protein [Cereibacter azotoformans]|uniref:Polysaccharide export outer membrane protein n=1 Tax=Cereibacter azotoformans TaxID=43057 RepID=A0A2T5KEZ3_9RHOB|nr:polysaccharide biosynthesis/export family protein [Cereibacter azotoformans]AXQ92674.1 polysaccharide export protein [Cereibacter sphaeroides]MBO4169740.1 polysaccharide biosynthesis/export family protein [Cereibacter azotoformans]PTR20999.1 polysaccharide export outer membrane protein [Cereibacter azotoformans]UIJ30954.1 polysaccharide biosynthesis/export family protein [Cereibacter azotoformans]ULB08718.1 polysaccharide biosynthesis/export family protein [Cereibacter azotoformans]